MPRIKIVTETILEIKHSKNQESIEIASTWAKKVSHFIELVRKTLVKDVDYINQRITSIKIQKDGEEK